MIQNSKHVDSSANHGITILLGPHQVSIQLRYIEEIGLV